MAEWIYGALVLLGFAVGGAIANFALWLSHRGSRQ